MYTLINSHIDKILDAINPATDVEPYVWLVRHFNDINVATHTEFQRIYRRYWQLYAARLSSSFCQSYFALLESSKSAQDVAVKTVAQQLLEVPTHGDARRSVQFSFASKLVHMINRRLPIYDSMVESFYFLPAGPAKESTDAKLERLVASYGFLVAEYTRVLQQGLLTHAIQRFRLRFHVGHEYTDNKIIDTLIWRFVGFMRGGAVRNKEVVYR
jgi:hypothetical protein